MLKIDFDFIVRGGGKGSFQYPYINNKSKDTSSTNDYESVKETYIVGPLN